MYYLSETKNSHVVSGYKEVKNNLMRVLSGKPSAHLHYHLAEFATLIPVILAFSGLGTVYFNSVHHEKTPPHTHTLSDLELLF